MHLLLPPGLFYILSTPTMATVFYYLINYDNTNTYVHIIHINTAGWRISNQEQSIIKTTVLLFLDNCFNPNTTLTRTTLVWFEHHNRYRVSVWYRYRYQYGIISIGMNHQPSIGIGIGMNVIYLVSVSVSYRY